MRNWTNFYLEIQDEPEGVSTHAYHEERARLARERRSDAAMDVLRGVLAERWRHPVSAHGLPRPHQTAFTSRTLPIDVWQI